MGEWSLYRDIFLRRKRSLEPREFMLSSPIRLPSDVFSFRAQIGVKNAPSTWYLGARIQWGIVEESGWARINGVDSSDIQINQPEVFLSPSVIRHPIFRLQIPYWIESARFYLWLLNKQEANAMSFFQPTDLSPAASGLDAMVSNSDTSVAVLASNANRKSFTIRNHSTATLYLALGPTATLQATIKLAPEGIYECPATYVGPVSGIWDAEDTNGYAAVLELVK